MAATRARDWLAAWLHQRAHPACLQYRHRPLVVFYADHGLGTLAARRVHPDAWARTLEEAELRPRTVARQLSSVASRYSYLVAEAVHSDSPTEHVRRPKLPDRGETPGLTRDELGRRLAAARYRSVRTTASLTMLATTGLRIDEALSRDVEHLGHDRGHRILRLDHKGGLATAPCSLPLLCGRSTTTSGTGAPDRSSSPRPSDRDRRGRRVHEYVEVALRE
jgi:integrase/recombinase XerD